MRIAARHAHPDQAIGAQRLAVAAAIDFGGERDIDSTRAQRFAHDFGILAHQADAHARLRLGEAAQDGWHEARNDVVGHTEPHLALEGGRAHGRPDLVVQRQQAARLSEQSFARGRQGKPPASALEQSAIERLLQSLDLLARRRLRHAERRRRTRDAARFDDREEGAQKREIEIFTHKNYRTIIS